MDTLEEQGIRLVALSESSLYSPKLVWKLRSFLKKNAYDIVHVHIFPSLYIAALATVFAGLKAKLCFTEHNTTNKRMENGFFRLVDRVIYRQYKAVICITDQVKENIENHLQQKSILFETVLNGINLKSFAISVEKPTDRKVVTMVARFSEHKNQQTLIEAARLLDESIHIQFVGEGALRASLENRVAAYNLQGRIHFLGLRKDVPAILKASHIGVLSSNWEGMPLSAIEVMAAEIPFIGSNVPGIADLVEADPSAGLLFENNDAQQLANHITHLLSDDAYYNQRAAACKKQAAQYGIDKMVEGYLDVYKKISHEKA